MSKKVIVAVTGASGSIYAQKLIEQMLVHSNKFKEIALIFSENGAIS